MKNYYQQLWRTRLVWLFLALLLPVLHVSAATTRNIKHLPATTDKYAYGGVNVLSSTASTQFFAEDKTISGSSTYYAFAAETAANKSSFTGTVCYAYFLGFTKTKDKAAQGIFDYTHSEKTLSSAKTGLDENETPVTTYYASAKLGQSTNYAVFTMVKIAAVNDADGKEFKGWRKQGGEIFSTETSITVKGTTTRTIYEGVFGDPVSDGKYCHAQITPFPTANAGLGTVALNTDSNVPATFAASGITDKDNEKKGDLYFFAKATGGRFLGFANGETAAKSGTYVKHSEAEGIYSATGLELGGTDDNSSDTTALNKVYAVFTMVDANAVSENAGLDGAGDLPADAKADVINASDESVVSGVIGYGQKVTLKATLPEAVSGSDWIFVGWRKKGSTTYESTELTYTVDEVTEYVEYEAVFADKYEIRIDSRAERDGKYWATVVNYNTNFCMVLPSTLTVYSLRFGDELSTETVRIGSPYTIEGVYGTEAARTITLSGDNDMQMDPIATVTYKKSNLYSGSTYQFKYAEGGYGDVPYSSTNIWAVSKASAQNDASSTNLQGVLVCADKPGVYKISNFMRHGTVNKNLGDGQTWPRYNRLSGRDEPLTPDKKDASCDYYVLSTKNGLVAFYRVAAGTTIPARRGYIRVNKASSSKEFIDFMPNNDTPTGIDTVSTTTNGDAPVYNLSGQRVGNDYKGIVIQNGKKFVRK